VTMKKSHGIQSPPTVSYGIAQLNAGGAAVTAALDSADAALYRAKALGRNQAVLASTAEP
jgi:PleD family two-component response regulator